MFGRQHIKGKIRELIRIYRQIVCFDEILKILYKNFGFSVEWKKNRSDLTSLSWNSQKILFSFFCTNACRMHEYVLFQTSSQWHSASIVHCCKTKWFLISSRIPSNDKYSQKVCHPQTIDIPDCMCSDFLRPNIQSRFVGYLHHLIEHPHRHCYA